MLATISPDPPVEGWLSCAVPRGVWSDPAKHASPLAPGYIRLGMILEALKPVSGVFSFPITVTCSGASSAKVTAYSPLGNWEAVNSPVPSCRPSKLPQAIRRRLKSGSLGGSCPTSLVTMMADLMCWPLAQDKRLISRICGTTIVRRYPPMGAWPRPSIVSTPSQVP